MVDASAVSRPPIVERQSLDGLASSGTPAMMNKARQAAATCTAAPAQSPDWFDAWTSAAEGDVTARLIAVPSSDGCLYLPVEIGRIGPVRIAQYVGGRHANGNFPVFEGEMSHLKRSQLVDAARAALPGVDLVRLERNIAVLDGRTNPLAALGQTPSPNIALAVDLSGGFDALLQRASGKRKRKKHRSQTRKFEAFGGHRRVEARNAQEVDRLLDAFFDMKAQRFRAMGVRDVFAPPRVRAAWRALFKNALDTERPAFVLHGLEVGGRLRAVTGSSLSGDRVICEFGAIADDEVASASPGEFLFFENIQDACRQGYAIYDFSVGDEAYKRLWCDLETQQFDVLVPLTIKGHLAVAALRARASMVRAVKSNRRIWGAVKRLRRGAVATSQPADD